MQAPTHEPQQTHASSGRSDGALNAAASIVDCRLLPRLVVFSSCFEGGQPVSQKPTRLLSETKSQTLLFDLDAVSPFSLAFSGLRVTRG